MFPSEHQKKQYGRRQKSKMISNLRNKWRISFLRIMIWREASSVDAYNDIFKGFPFRFELFIVPLYPSRVQHRAWYILGWVLIEWIIALWLYSCLNFPINPQELLRGSKMILWLKRTFVNYKALYKRERPLALLCRCAYILTMVTPMALSFQASERRKWIFIKHLLYA